MKPPKRRLGLGLIARLVIILLLTVGVEFGVSTWLYERASQFSVRDDEARRLAEHLVISRRLVGGEPPASRPKQAAALSTDRYALRWDAAATPPSTAASLLSTRRQILDWEPALAGSDLRLRLTSPGRRSVLAGALTLPDGSWLQFQTLQPVAGLNLASERIALALVPALALMAIGGMLVRRALSPLRQLAAAADLIGDGRNGGAGAPDPVPETGPGEVTRVIGAFNRMAERIHALIDDRTQALAAVGHDFRTPLARLRLRAEAINDPVRRAAIEGDIAEMEAMVASLLAYLGGAEDAEPPVATDLAVLCATLVDDAADRGHAVDYRGPDHLPLSIRRTALKRAVGNLLDNALRFGTTVSVSLTPTPDAVVIAVEDDGPGIPPDMLDRVLEPFVRAGAARERDTAGFGLGLAIVKRMVEDDGGALALSNRSTGGLRAAITLRRNNSLHDRAAAAKVAR